MHLKKHLNFTALRAAMAQCFRQIEDRRQVGKVGYCLHDVLMSGFAMMYFQDPSILSFQRRLQECTQFNNLTTVFDIGSIPKETQMRDVIAPHPHPGVERHILGLSSAIAAWSAAFPLSASWRKVSRGHRRFTIFLFRQYQLSPVFEDRIGQGGYPLSSPDSAGGYRPSGPTPGAAAIPGTYPGERLR